MEYDATAPRTVYALRITPAAGSVRAVPELAQGKVFTDDDSKGRETISQMVTRTGAIGGINGDFFPFTGDPLGLMVRNGQLLSEPVKARAAFGWGDLMSAASVINWHITLQAEGLDPLEVDGIDQSCPLNGCVINDATAGMAICSKPAVSVVVKCDQPSLPPNGQLVGIVQTVFDGSTSVPIGDGSFIVMGEGDKAAYLNSLRPGQKITFNVQTQGFDWSKITHAIGGGPMLLQNGHPFVDWQDEDFRPDFANSRHPRSAVGRTLQGDMWFVAVDGRQPSSIGATLDEMATIMQQLGCQDAINLDGGGSTDINLFGLVLNRPVEKEAGQEQVTTERKVANGVLIYGDRPQPDESTYKIMAPTSVLTTDAPDLTVTKDDGSAVPNTDVIWASAGAAFIDQGGRLHCSAAGNATVQAFVHGQVISAVVAITQPTPPTTPPKTAAKPVKVNKSGGHS